MTLIINDKVVKFDFPMTAHLNKKQRVSERFNIEMKVKLICHDGAVYTCTTRNISEGGIFVLIADVEIPVGEMVTINKIKGQNDFIKLANDTAVVVHKESDGIGLAFVDLSLR